MTDTFDDYLPSPWGDIDDFSPVYVPHTYDPDLAKVQRREEKANKEWNKTWGKLCDERYDGTPSTRFRRDVTPEQVKELIEQGADVNCKVLTAFCDPKKDYVDAPLNAIPYGKDYNIIADLLVQNGADIDFVGHPRDDRTKLTKSVLRAIVRIGHKEWKDLDEEQKLMIFYLSRGANPNATTRHYEWTPNKEETPLTLFVQCSSGMGRKDEKQKTAINNLAKMLIAYGATLPPKGYNRWLSNDLKDIFANIDKSRAEGKILAGKILDEIETEIDTYYQEAGWSRKSLRSIKAVKDLGTKRYIKALKELKARPTGPTDEKKKDLRDVFNKADKKGKETLAKILSRASKPRKEKAKQLWEDRKAYHRYLAAQKRLKNR